MLVKEAKAIVGGLSDPDKLPCHSFGLPAGIACHTGARLAKCSGSVCEGCYAWDRGMYQFPVVKLAQQRRLESVEDPQWVNAMVALVAREKSGYFRWFDSGDIQGFGHLHNIVTVCRRTSHIKHWLPTHEIALIKRFFREGNRLPANLVIRLSAAMIDGRPVDTRNMLGVQTSTVHLRQPAQGRACPAPQQDNHCGTCRACWSRRVKNISYHKH